MALVIHVAPLFCLFCVFLAVRQPVSYFRLLSLKCCRPLIIKVIWFDPQWLQLLLCIFIHMHSKSNIHINAYISCWPVLSVLSQGVAGCWCEAKVTGLQRGSGHIFSIQTLYLVVKHPLTSLQQNCSAHSKPVAWGARFGICVEKRNPLFSMQTHARILPVETCLVLPGPALWGPLLGPDLLCFHLPKTPQLHHSLQRRNYAWGTVSPQALLSLSPFGYDWKVAEGEKNILN